MLLIQVVKFGKITSAPGQSWGFLQAGDGCRPPSAELSLLRWPGWPSWAAGQSHLSEHKATGIFGCLAPAYLLHCRDMLPYGP